MVRKPNDLLVQGDPLMLEAVVSAGTGITWGIVVTVVFLLLILTTNMRPPGPPGVPSDDAGPT